MAHNNSKSVVAVVNVPKVQLKDDVLTIALANGFTQADVERMEKQDAYRRAYSQRPEVVEKRKQYAARRHEKMKVLRNLLSQQTQLLG
jgi:hypothetical protein